MTRMSFQLSDELPSCSRCSGPLIMAGKMPQRDAFGRPIALELCRACDTGDTAAAALLGFFTSGAGNDISRAEEAAQLMVDFQKEVMARHGYALVNAGEQTRYRPYTGEPPMGIG